MRRFSAIIQILFVLATIGYATVSLYRGNFEQAMAAFPMLVVYYLFLLALDRKKGLRREKHN